MWTAVTSTMCAVVALMVLGANVACGRCFGKEDARASADSAMHEFCAREKIDVSQFGSADERFQDNERLWLFVYVDKNNHQEIAVSVSCRGGVEVSHLPADRTK